MYRERPERTNQERPGRGRKESVDRDLPVVLKTKDKVECLMTGHHEAIFQFRLQNDGDPPANTTAEPAGMDGLLTRMASSASNRPDWST